MTDADKRTPALSRGKKLTFIALLVAVSGAFALLVAEVVLRLVPIPGVTYHSFYFDEVTGGHSYPHTTLIYRSARGDFVKRYANAWGYPDVEHEMEKPEGVYRIGFFGDSYTEAMQVPLADTFFRRIEREINRRLDAGSATAPFDSVETLCFGVSGRSTVQSYLESKRWMDRVDLDEVVYVFCNNDPSDQIRSIKRSTEIPYALLEGDSFVVDNAFRDLYGYKTGRVHRAWQYLKAHSLVLSTLEGRLKLLRRYGIKMKPTEADMQMEADTDGFSATAPATWPDSLYAYGETLLARVIDRWREDVEAGGRRFTILYIPKEKQIAEPINKQASWAQWLYRYCSERHIDLIDPTPELLERVAEGEEVYYDHLTVQGHAAFTEAFSRRFADRAFPAARQ